MNIYFLCMCLNLWNPQAQVFNWNAWNQTMEQAKDWSGKPIWVQRPKLLSGN